MEVTAVALAPPDARAAAPRGAADTLRTRTVSAVRWSLGAQVALRLLHFAIVVVLARLLAPEAFGLFAMITVVTGFATIFSDVGFGAALIQRSVIDERHRSSVFWLSAGVGAALTVTLTAASPAIAWFFDASILVPLMTLVSLDFLLNGLIVVHVAVMRRVLRFRTIAVVELLATAGGGMAGIASAAMGAGVWSFAIWILTTSVIKVGLLWRSSVWRPALVWDTRAMRDLLAFSRNLLGFTTVNYWIRNADKLLVGRFLSAWALGIYARSYALMLLPLMLVTRAISAVMFPAMAEIQHDRQRVARLYLRTTRAVGLITFPLMIGLFVVADDFVLALFGVEWAAMTPIVRMFCLAGLLESIGSLNGNLYLSQGRADLQLRVGSIIGVIGIAAVAIGLAWGLLALAAAYAAYTALVFFPSLRIAIGLVDLSVRDVVSGLLPSALGAASMGACVWLLARLLPPAWPAAASLSVQTVFGVVVYAALICRTATFRDVRTVLMR